MRESLSFAKVGTHFMQRHRRRTQRALTVALFSSHYYIPSIPSFPPLAFHVHRVVQVPMQFLFSTFFTESFIAPTRPQHCPLRH